MSMASFNMAKMWEFIQKMLFVIFLKASFQNIKSANQLGLKLQSVFFWKEDTFKLHKFISPLSGLAVSDIHKIQEEVDTYYHISIVETLASTSFVSLPAEEVTIYPNIRPEHPKILGIPIPGFKVGSNPPAITGSPIPLINYLLTYITFFTISILLSNWSWSKHSRKNFSYQLCK